MIDSYSEEIQKTPIESFQELTQGLDHLGPANIDQKRSLFLIGVSLDIDHTKKIDFIKGEILKDSPQTFGEGFQNPLQLTAIDSLFESRIPVMEIRELIAKSIAMQSDPNVKLALEARLSELD